MFFWFLLAHNSLFSSRDLPSGERQLNTILQPGREPTFLGPKGRREISGEKVGVEGRTGVLPSFRPCYLEVLSPLLLYRSRRIGERGCLVLYRSGWVVRPTGSPLSLYGRLPPPPQKRVFLLLPFIFCPLAWQPEQDDFFSRKVWKLFFLGSRLEERRCTATCFSHLNLWFGESSSA